MIDKFTFYQNKTQIEHSFSEANIDIRSVLFSGRWLYDDPTDSVVFIRLLSRVEERKQQMLLRALNGILNTVGASVQFAEEPSIREITWDNLKKLGEIIDRTVELIEKNLDKLYGMAQSLSTETGIFPDISRLNDALRESGISDSTVADMIEIGRYYFDCIGERPYINNNIYRHMRGKLGPEFYQRAKEILEYSIDWNPHYTAANNRIVIMSKMLSLQKIDLNHDGDQSGQLCLHKAVFGRHHEMVELLLEHGADPRIKDDRVNSALDIEKLMRCVTVRRMLESKINELEQKEYEEWRQEVLNMRP